MSLATALTLSLLMVAPSAGGIAEGIAEGPARSEGAAIGPDGPVPVTVLWRDYVRVERPRSRGRGLLIATGATFGVGVLVQLGNLAFAQDRGVGVVERAFFASTMVLAPIGGFVRGRYDAYTDRSLGRTMRRPTGMIALGFTMAGLGAIGGLLNEAFWWPCVVGETGPYYQPGPINQVAVGPQCHNTLSRAALDGATLLVAGGLGLATWGLKYRHDARAYERAVLAVVPRVRAGEVGLGVTGRF
ncbi:MAG: hypothetical protein R3B09_07535 [Nannocystaceae bacterium]